VERQTYHKEKTPSVQKRTTSIMEKPANLLKKPPLVREKTLHLYRIIVLANK
jgi:hypothetical protein